jgi:putative SOS response-associated peptidase YedK
MVMILPDAQYDAWLTAPVEATRDFLNPYRADALIAAPVVKTPTEKRPMPNKPPPPLERKRLE